MDVDHRQLDQIGGGALDGGVGRHPLTEATDVRVLGIELGYVAPPAEQRLDIALLSRQLDLAVQVLADRGEAREVVGDELPGLGDADAELSRQRRRALTVDRREVDRLGLGAHRRRDLVGARAEDERRGVAMHVAPVLKRLDECGIAGEMGENSQLDL